jgi:hypothetical protein
LFAQEPWVDDWGKEHWIPETVAEALEELLAPKPPLYEPQLYVLAWGLNLWFVDNNGMVLGRVDRPVGNAILGLFDQLPRYVVVCRAVDWESVLAIYENVEPPLESYQLIVTRKGIAALNLLGNALVKSPLMLLLQEYMCERCEIC